MFQVQLTKVQLLRLKHRVLQEMKLYEFDPKKTEVQTCDSILAALDQAQAEHVALTKPQLLYLQEEMLAEMEQYGYDGDAIAFRACAEVLQALEGAKET
jgi:hypothetical protein